MAPKIFIDGDQGTTGLQIRERLAARKDIQLVRLPDDKRKDAAARREALNGADIAILCLPDEAAREAAAMVQHNGTRIIDASSAHRVAPGWVYGFPEFLPGQAEAIAEGARVSNPGCYPTGAVALVRPLVDAGLLPLDFAATVHAVSGYSGGGKAMIADYEGAKVSSKPFKAYGLQLEHKHTEEMRVHSGLLHRPLFAPGVGPYYKGMLVFVPLQLWALKSKVTPGMVEEVLVERYRGQKFVTVAPAGDVADMTGLEPQALNDTNEMRLYVFGNAARGQALLAAQLDNLGKGASGAAVQNLNLMLGVDPATGLL